MRKAASVDANQPVIVATFRKLGATVQILSAVGKGCPDLLIGYRGINLLVEVKDGSKKPSARQLTPDQVVWHEAWRGQKCVIETVDQAIALIEQFACQNR